MSKMSTSKELIEVGKELGLYGKELQEFIRDTQAQERADREAVRVAKKEAAEQEVKMKECEARLRNEELEHQTNFKIRTLEAEAVFKKAVALEEKERALAEKEKLREESKRMELEYKKLLLDQGKNPNDADVRGEGAYGEGGSVHSYGTGTHTNGKLLRGPKMPAFEEEKDDLDSYLFRFERYALTQHWEKKDWAVCLSTLLKGKALEVYGRLPGDDALDYDTLKDALLRRFQLTEDGFKHKFRNTRPEKGESPRQFMVRLNVYLQRWIDMARITQTYDGVLDLLVKEQYVDTCPRELAVFLKERRINDVDELARVAEQYLEAHPVKQGEAKKPRSFSSPKRSETQGNRIPTEVRNERQAKGQCFLCGKSGHLARHCSARQTMAGLEVDDCEETAGMEWQPSRSPRQPRHKFKENIKWSPRRQRYDESRRSSATLLRCKQHKKVECVDCFETVRVNDHRTQCNAMKSDHVELKCGCVCPVIMDACRNRENKNRMPVAEGWIEDYKGTVLRDTGCSTVVVRRSLVADELLTGAEETCVLIDGTVRRTPVAVISVRTPFLTGSVKAVCMKNPFTI
jgi:hypothetical protein